MPHANRMHCPFPTLVAGGGGECVEVCMSVWYSLDGYLLRCEISGGAGVG